MSRQQLAPEFEFRPARKDECRAIAELYRIASDGVAEYVWTRLAAPGEDPLDVGARRYARENTDFSYQNVTIAIRGEEILGMMAAYAMGTRERPANEFDFDVDPVLMPYHKLEQPNSFYVSGMALFPEHRGQGIGTRFLERAQEKAHAAGLAQLSLIVLEQNEGAFRLYRRFGFREVAREPVVPHRLIRHTGDALLMVKTV